MSVGRKKASSMWKLVRQASQAGLEVRMGFAVVDIVAEGDLVEDVVGFDLGIELEYYVALQSFPPWLLLGLEGS